MEHNAVSIAPHDVYGIISMVLRTITLIVSVKYVSLVIRADLVQSFGVLHEHAVIVRVLAAGVPHVRPGHRIEVRNLGSTSDGLVHVTVQVGFLDRQDIPRNLALVVGDAPELDFDLDAAHYFISVLSLLPPQQHPFSSWPQRLFLALERNQADRTEVFHLPPTRTVVMGSEPET
jgi:KUP system potassium uptake protein